MIGPSAEREIEKLDSTNQKRVFAALTKLAADPRRSGVVKLSQRDNFWRMRAGDYRIIYLIEEPLRRILVLVVRHRREAYRDLDILEDRLIAALRRDR